MEKTKNRAGYSPKLRLWAEEACRESAVPFSCIDTRYALFPRSFLDRINELPRAKKVDFFFAGALKIDKATSEARAWLLPFIKQWFGDRSYLQFTDAKTKADYVALGPYDHTLMQRGFVPKEVPARERGWFDETYYRNMCASEFTLCPAGDQNWSLRFYESIVCGSIPIVVGGDFYRTPEEAKIGYRVISELGPFTFSESVVEHNTQLFLKHHVLQT